MKKYVFLVFGLIMIQSSMTLAAPFGASQQPQKWNIPLINQNDDEEWNIQPDENFNTPDEESDIENVTFPENQSSDPDIVFPEQNSFQDLDVGDNFDPALRV